MTDDEQEASSFRYVAPRVFILSSGNVAVIPMIGRDPPRIIPMEQFDPRVDLPGMHDLENAYQRAQDTQRAAARSAAPPKPRQTSLDDLA